MKKSTSQTELSLQDSSALAKFKSGTEFKFLDHAFLFKFTPDSTTGYICHDSHYYCSVDSFSDKSVHCYVSIFSKLVHVNMKFSQITFVS